MTRPRRVNFPSRTNYLISQYWCNEAAVGGSRPLLAVETTMIQPDRALFPVTGIFQQGASEWYRISNAPREAARNINDRGEEDKYEYWE
jgi:hypothetical protein